MRYKLCILCLSVTVLTVQGRVVSIETPRGLLLFMAVFRGGIMKKGALVLSLVYLLAVAAGCERSRGELRLAASSSLTDVLNECVRLYETESTDVKIVPVYGSAGSLQRQIESGAPLDLFLSASVRNMDALEQQGLIYPESRRDIVRNRLVLIVPAGETQSVSFKDLASDAVSGIAIGEPGSVPAGYYAKQVLDTIEVYDAVYRKVVFAKNVRQVLYYVETGDVPAGIVYASDAAGNMKVRICAYADEGAHDRILYPGAVISDSKNREQALSFLQWLSGETARGIFLEYGFGAL